MYKRKTKLSPIHISLIALAILVVIAVIVTFAVKKDEPKEPTTQVFFLFPVWSASRWPRKKPALKLASYMILLPSKAAGRHSRRRKSSSVSTTRCRRA